MAIVPPFRKNIQLPEVTFRAGVSESTAQNIGASINFINAYQHSEKQWFINGQYNLITIPFTAIDGLVMMEFNAEIIDAFFYVQHAGTGGDTTMDIEYATAPGGSWTSIFSTKPSINYAAGDFSWTYVGASFSNTTAPVLSTTLLNANTVLRANISAAQNGTTAKGCGLVLHYRPR